MDQFTQFVTSLVEGWVGGLEQSGYLGIFILMAIESSFLPLPSEVVMLPAGALAAQGKMTVWGAILAGTLGSLVGALFNYYFALFLGRTFLLRYGKYFFVPEEKLLWAEKHWHQHGELTTFVCRLLPVIRHLISLPAGLAKMNLARFCFWTTFGAALWVAILTYTGYYLGPQAEQIWHTHQTAISLALVGGTALIVVLYVVRFVLKQPKAAPVDGKPVETASLR